MNITLRQMRALVAVADTGHIGAAAEKVNLSQSAISLAVSEAEKQIGLSLFERTTRSLRITPFGESAIPRMRRILADCDLLHSDMQSAIVRRSGCVTVACLASIASRIMPRVIAASHERHPDASIVLVDDNAAGVYAAVRDRRADFGFCGEWQTDSDLVFEPTMRDPLRLVCTKRHRLTRRREVAWRDLAAEPFVALSATTGIRFTIEQGLAASGIELTIAFEVSQLASALGLLEAGLGISALPALALPRPHTTNLVTRPLTRPHLQRTIGILRRKDRPLTPAADMVRDAIRKICAGINSSATQ